MTLVKFATEKGHEISLQAVGARIYYAQFVAKQQLFEQFAIQ